MFFFLNVSSWLCDVPHLNFSDYFAWIRMASALCISCHVLVILSHVMSAYFYFLISNDGQNGHKI